MKKHEKKPKNLFEKKMADPSFRKRFEQTYPEFELEVQLLRALEERKWNLSMLAAAMHTKKSNVSRDLSGGGIRKASIDRIAKMAGTLGYELIPLLIKQGQEKELYSSLYKQGLLK